MGQKAFRRVLSFGLVLTFVWGVDQAFGSQAPGQKASVNHRKSLIYATARDGTPAAGLTAADLEVKLAGNPISDFTLAKGASQNKLVFLVFDTATLSSNLLSRSKKIAQSAVSQIGDGVQFVVMSIDPGAGLKSICGPTADKELVSKSIARSVASKSSIPFRGSATDSSRFVDTPQADKPYAGNGGFSLADRVMEGRDDQRQERQVGTVLLASLRTLNAVLTRFPESDKVVEFYSSGIPQLAAMDPSAVSRPSLPTDRSDGSRAWPSEPPSVDSSTLDDINSLGQGIKNTGAVLFAIDMAGARLGEDNIKSGERSLRMLVNKSGGRFFKGTDEEITGSLAAAERGAYELSVPLPQETPDATPALEVRAKNPDIMLSSVPSGARSFAEMEPEEQRAVITSILDNDLVGDIGLKVIALPVNTVAGGGDVTVLSVQLPWELELGHWDWDVYKAWRSPQKGVVEMEKVRLRNESPILRFSMKNKPDRLLEAVLVQTKSGTAFVCKAKNKPMS